MRVGTLGSGSILRALSAETGAPANRNPAPLGYSRKGMPTAENKIAKEPGFVYLPLIAGWLVPGAGHFLLRKWGRGALLSASILSMFAMGLAMQGKLYSSAHDVLDLLGLVGDLGNGLLFLVSRVLGLGAEQVQVTTADYGTRFIVVAGLLNVIAAVDAHNLRTGRKS
jgi:TM2 domain-containing membrane protein YozV